MELTGRCGSRTSLCLPSWFPFWPELPSRIQVGLLLVCASGLTQRNPSLDPTYAAVPPPTPIAVKVQFRAPFGAGPVQPLVRSGLISDQWTSPADCVFALSVRYTR